MDVTQTVRTASHAPLNKDGLIKHTGGNLAPFYTPAKVAQLLTDWAVVDAQSLIIDPSYGGCAFLNAAFLTLKRKGSPKPERQVFGVDIDPAAQSYLGDLFAAGAARHQYINYDFFDVSPEHFEATFGAGNHRRNQITPRDTQYPLASSCDVDGP